MKYSILSALIVVCAMFNQRTVLIKGKVVPYDAVATMVLYEVAMKMYQNYIYLDSSRVCFINGHKQIITGKNPGFFFIKSKSISF